MPCHKFEQGLLLCRENDRQRQTTLSFDYGNLLNAPSFVAKLVLGAYEPPYFNLNFLGSYEPLEIFVFHSRKVVVSCLSFFVFLYKLQLEKFSELSLEKHLNYDRYKDYNRL